MKKVVLFKSASEDYERVFTDNNYQVAFVEPLQFTFINLDTLKEKLSQNEYEGLILTSPRAVEAVSKCWDPTKFVTWSTKRVYTVGHASSQKITLLLGLEALGSTTGNAENLAKLIAGENSKTSKFLFPCGSLRSESLPNILQTQGITVDSITVYETKENENLKEDLMALSDSTQEPCCMVFFSPSGCEYIHRQLQTFNNKLSTLPRFAIGNSTAHKIEILGLDIAGVAAKPVAESILESVNSYFSNLNN
ncbi:uroporphyrinogen-III synthase-like [Galleria mellonella]|uniref:Uroporphyrinogen-III synthase n=1 Tax=Galleria mellonella TaxID=7137 RepID=A0A6J1X1T6_GALME|nr:uroporphyrinogen-III synthase-like [Galleria mellonella]XP_026763346.1 uroporphyrinogen-III synthase-like [Galleria mellonella]